jgi:PAS domain S-box-containing protein
MMARKRTNAEEFGDPGSSRKDRRSLEEITKRDDPSHSEGLSKNRVSRASGAGHEDDKHPHDADLLRLVFESATDFAIFVQDNSGNVISWNVGAERLTGFPEEEILHRNGDVIFTPEDRSAGAPEQERSRASLTGRSEDERWHQRKDGSRFWGSGLMMRLRTGGGYVKIMRDRTAQHVSEHELRESEARFRMLAISIPQLVFRSRADGARNWGSPQWEVYAGLSDADSRGFGWLEAVHPDDRELTQSRWRDAERLGEYYVEHRIRRAADGEYRWHQTRAKPAGKSAREWVGTSADVHEMRGLQDRQQVLLAELQHRTRNLLALVQAIARQTVKTSASMADFLRQFESRLGALSRVQGVLASTNHGPIDLRQIVQMELKAHGAAEMAEVDGPSVDLAPDAAQALSLAVHELATNAVKYGALREPPGKLSVKWQLRRDKSNTTVVIEWRERGVAMPDPAAARTRGYGRELIERALPYQLNATTHYEFTSDGVRCTVELPLVREK